MRTNKDMEKHLPLLKRLLNYIDMSEFRITTGDIISPAQRLRNQADELEQQERDFYELRTLIDNIESNSTSADKNLKNENQ